MIKGERVYGGGQNAKELWRTARKEGEADMIAGTEVNNAGKVAKGALMGGRAGGQGNKGRRQGPSPTVGEGGTVGKGAGATVAAEKGN